MAFKSRCGSLTLPQPFSEKKKFKSKIKLNCELRSESQTKM